MQNEPMPDLQPATKADTNALKADIHALRTDLGTLRTDLEIQGKEIRKELRAEIQESALSVRNDLGKAISQLDSKLDANFTQFMAFMIKLKSDVLKACEHAVFRAEKVEHDQLFTRQRLDALESRQK